MASGQRRGAAFSYVRPCWYSKGTGYVVPGQQRHCVRDWSVYGGHTNTGGRGAGGGGGAKYFQLPLFCF